tara:strand:+ start:1962 stop:2522 length:561 start_codon:yes stop_codon:yes gene_type:complete
MSILRTNQITNTAGTGTPSFPNGIAGSVLQVKYHQQTTSFTQTGIVAATDTPITNMQVDIKPVSTSSVIKLEASMMFESASQAWSMMYFFYRNTIKLGNTDSDIGNRRGGIMSPSISYFAAENNESPENVHLTWYDTPQITSNITYKLGFNQTGTDTLFVNRTITDTNNSGFERGVSFISATEIGG